MSECDGVRVRGPIACLAAGKLDVQGAEALLWSQPAECAPDRVPVLMQGTYELLCVMSSIMACLARTDVDPARRREIAAVAARLGLVLADVQPLTQPAP